MQVRTLLLISDDPDDHIEFSEALYEVSDDAVLMSVSDMKKALDLLALRKCVPEYIFLNVNIGEADLPGLRLVLQTPELSKVAVIAYGESPEAKDLNDEQFRFVPDIHSSYSALKAYFLHLLAR